MCNLHYIKMGFSLTKNGKNKKQELFVYLW